MRSGRLTCRGLVERYLARIAAYDKTGPAINALVVVNPRALAVADSLDLLRRRNQPMGPLFHVPMIVKDNFETVDLNTPHGDNSQLFSPSTGFPAINVPMGHTREGRLPAGLSLLARPFAEATLFRLAYAYEQATHHRGPPPTTPALP